MKKVTIIGSGLVGATSAYALMLRELADVIALVDMDNKKVEAELADLEHGFPALSKTHMIRGSYADCANSDLVVITAGVTRKVGETRADLLKKNAEIMENICHEIKKTKTNAVILVVSNPVDILTNKAAEALSLPAGRVFGTGCSLDTSRLVALLANRFDTPIENIQALIVGEHSDAQIIDWDKVFINGQKPNLTDVQKQEIADIVKKTGMNIIEGKGKTYYGIATSVCAIARSVLCDIEAEFSLSVPNFDRDLAVSRLVKVNKNGIILN